MRFQEGYTTKVDTQRAKGTQKRILVFCVLFLLICTPYVLSSAKYDNAIYHESVPTERLPDHFSWRDIEGIDYTTSVKDQEPCAACEAFTTVSIIETLVQYEVGHPFDCDLSEALLFFMNDGKCDFGTNFTRMFNFLMEYGVPDEGAFPYENRNYETPISEAVPDWQNRTVKINGWGVVENNFTSIKEALIEHGPLFVLITQSNDLFRYRGGVFYPHRPLSPAHVVTIVGYNDTGRFWLIKNSWGTTWGEDGWCRLSYDADMFISGDGTIFENISGGGTGIFFIDGVYGNLQPDVPIIKIVHPERTYSYSKDRYWYSLLLKRLFRSEFMVWVQQRIIQRRLFGDVILDTRIPKIFQGTTIVINTTGDNITKVELYIDNALRHTSVEPCFTWYWGVDVPDGKHELKAVAYNAHGSMSKDIRDIYTFT